MSINYYEPNPKQATVRQVTPPPPKPSDTDILEVQECIKKVQTCMLVNYVNGTSMKPQWGTYNQFISTQKMSKRE